jgi:cytochrome c553
MRNISLIFRRVAKSVVLVTILSMATLFVHAQDIKEGESLFKSDCSACHGVDRAVIGPALKGTTERHDEAWLISWIRNSQALIASGDETAIQLFEDHNKLMMPAFPTLSDDNIRNILAYVDDASKPAPAAAGGEGVAGQQAGASGDVSNFMFGGLIVVLIIAFLVILVLNRVIRTLDRIILKNRNDIAETDEGEEDGGESSGKVFVDKLKKLSRNKKLVFFVVLGIVALLSTAGWNVMWNVGVHEGYQPVQPIKFSHQLHAGVNQIDCQYCHSGAATSKNASIPSLNVCMNCHNHVTASDKYNGDISPEIQKIYNAIDWDPDTRSYGTDTKPVEWIRIHNLPDLAYFNHSQHVTVAGIECQKCHGPVETMAEVYQYSPLTMKWCIDCHKDTEVNSKDNAYYEQLIAAHDQLKSGEKITAAVLGGLECGKCHY